MRILWLNVGGLWPLNTGGRQRSFNIISELTRRHRVVLLTTHGPKDDHEALAARLPDCERIVSIPHVPPKHGTVRFAAALLGSWLSPLPVNFIRWRVPALRRQVLSLMATAKIDICVADFLHAVPNLPRDWDRVPVILFEHNVEHIIWKRLCRNERRPWRRLLLEIEWRKMRRYEAKVCARSRLTLCVSDADRAVLADAAPGAGVREIPTGVDLSYFHPNGWRESAAEMVFSGSMDWYPNEDAALRFMESILPRIRREMPGVSFTIVGRNPSPGLLSAASAAGARVTGTVEDVRPYVAQAGVYIVPLRIGGGTRLKIFEALAMGKAVVSTRIGAEGLPLTPGEHFLEADHPEEFARAVVSLIRDPERRRELGNAGRRLVEERYSWPQVAREFESNLKEVFDRYAG